MIARCKARDAQYPKWVLYKMWRYMPKDFGVEVSLTTVGVSDDAVAVQIDAAAQREGLVAPAADEVELAVALVLADADPLDAAGACVSCMSAARR